MKPDETILLYVGMSRKIHTSSQKSQEAKRGRQIHSSILKINSLKYFSLPFTLLEPFGAVIIMNSKVHLTKIA